MPTNSIEELRNSLSVFALEQAKSRRTSREIAVAFLAENRSLVASVSDPLLITALIKELNVVGERHPKPAIVADQGDLFSGFPNIPALVSNPVTDEHGKRRLEKTTYFDFNYEEGALWIDRRLQQREQDLTQVMDARRALERAEPFIKGHPEKTIYDGLVEARSAEEEVAELEEAGR